MNPQLPRLTDFAAGLSSSLPSACASCAKRATSCCQNLGKRRTLYAAPYDAGKVLEVDPETSNVKEICDALEVGENTNVLLQAPTKNALQQNQAQQKSWRSTPQSFLF
jgi:hypothetical protein